MINVLTDNNLLIFIFIVITVSHFVWYRKSLQILIFWCSQEKMMTLVRPYTQSWLENKSIAPLKAKMHLDMLYFNFWHCFMCITWSIPSRYVILTSIYNSLYWEIIMWHQHLEFSTAIMKLFKSTWCLPTLCKFRTLAVSSRKFKLTFLSLKLTLNNPPCTIEWLPIQGTHSI